MILADLEKKITSKVINKVWKEQFNSEMSFKGLTLSSAKRLYENLCSDINDIRHKNYLVSEKNAKYLSMLATARFLTEYIHEKTYLTEVTMGITAKQAIDRSKLAREQANLALEIAIRNIAELYLLNIGRQWARRHPNNTLEIDFSMAAMGLVIDAQKITNKQLLASNFWITVEKNLEEICGKYFKFGTPRDMTIDNGYITFKNSEFRPIKPLKVHENKNSLLEVDKDYHTGVGMALGHGVNTVKNFAPHVAGSAIGAFVGGLKGQALKSNVSVS